MAEKEPEAVAVKEEVEEAKEEHEDIILDDAGKERSTPEPVAETEEEPKTPIRSSGILGKDFTTPAKKEEAAATPAETPEVKQTPTSDEEKLTASQKISSWWTTKAKPGLSLFGESSVRGMTIVKQRFSEQLGRSTKTVDLDLQPRIEQLRGLRTDYQSLATASGALAKNLAAFAHAHEDASHVFEEVAGHKDVLASTFHAHSQFLGVVGRNAVGLGEACSFFRDQAQQLARQVTGVLTIVRDYNTARVEYDGYRVTYEKLKAANSPKVETSEKRYLDSYNRLQEHRAETVKALNDFDNDKLATMQQQLNGLLNAYSMFLSGNQSAVTACLETMKKDADDVIDTPPKAAEAASSASA